MEDSQTDTATRAVMAKTSLGEGIHPQKLCRAGSAAMRERKDASNAGDGEIDGSSSSALHSERNSSARERQAAQADRCSSTARRSAGRARPSRYSTNLLSSAAHCFPLFFEPNMMVLTSFGKHRYTRTELLTSGASSTRNVSYALNNSDFSALSEHSRTPAISS
jgi:hypothetical protein